MPKWILYVPMPGCDDEVGIPYEAHEEKLLDEAIDSIIRNTGLTPSVQWL